MTQTTQPKVALIAGVTGQDGAYLSELLHDKGLDENVCPACDQVPFPLCD